VPAPQPNVYFTNVHVDSHPVPNKPFVITADLQNPNPNDLLAYISAPNGITVVSPIVSSLAFTISQNTQRASWTLIAGAPGSYSVTLIAHTNFPTDTEKIDLVVNVGSPHSLAVTDINIPGNIFPSNNFTVGIKLKNTSIVKDDNVIAQISVPAGLQLLDDASSKSISMDPNQEVLFNWRIKAEVAGSYVLFFNYSSTNSGRDSVIASVNVGTIPVATGALLAITAQPITLELNAITPVVFDITNNGVHPIHNLQIVSASGGAYTSVDTPALIGDLGVNVSKDVALRIYTSNQTLSLKVPVTVRYDTNGINYNETYWTGLPLQNTPNFKIGTVNVTPNLSFAGDVADKIDVQIFNLGLGVNDVYTTLNLPSGLSPAWGNATSEYFGRIDTFQTVTASFFINIDSKAPSGNYPLSVSINDGKEKTSLSLNYIVSKKSIFQLISSDSSQLYPGAASVPFRVTMQNIGSAPAQTMTTQLLSGNYVPGVKSGDLTTVCNTENIGNVLPSQVFTTTFLVNLDPAFVPGDQSTSVQINWTQNITTTSNSFVQVVVVPYHVAHGPYYLLYYGGIPWTYVMILIAITVLVYLFLKKRRSRIRLIKSIELQERAMDQEILETSKLQTLEDISAVKKKEHNDNTNKPSIENNKDTKKKN
jgi:hypothetical protein